MVAQGGVQTIHGDQALEPGPGPEVEGDTDSDLARIRRQQIVLSAILQQVTSAGTLLNPAKLDAFLQAFVQNTFTDNVTIDDLVTLAQSFGNLDPSRVTFFTLPTVPSASNPDALDVDESKAPAVFDALLNDQPLPGEPAATSTQQHPGDARAVADARRAGWPPASTVDPGTIDLAIVNVSGRSGVATAGDGEAERRRLRTSPTTTCWPRTARPQTGVTVEYDPTNLTAALTVAAAVPGATVVPRRAGSTGAAAARRVLTTGRCRPCSAGDDAPPRTMGSATATADTDGRAPDRRPLTTADWPRSTPARRSAPDRSDARPRRHRKPLPPFIPSFTRRGCPRARAASIV